MSNIQLEHAQHQAKPQRFPLVFLAHDIEVPMNIGSLFRIADALGIEKIYLSGTSPVPPNAKIRRTSRACEKYVPFAYHADPLEIVRQCKLDGYTILSLEISSASIPLRELVLPPDAKLCLILGAENHGVSQALLDASDHSVHIPMLGHNSSMNVANACAIASYELTCRLQPYAVQI